MRVIAGKHHGLIANQTCAAVDGMRITPQNAQIGLGPNDEETAGLMEAVETREIEIAAIHQIECARFGQQLIEDVDLVQFAVADVEKRWDITAQIEQGMQFDGGLGRAEWCPRKHRQTQVDGGGIQRVDRTGEIGAEGLVGIKAARRADQMLREVGIDAPVARGIRMGQGIACNEATDAEMIELGALRAKTCFDVAQAFAIGQLRESHAQVLIEAREAFDLVLALVASNASPESGERQVLHDLSENEFAMVHL